MDNNSALGLAKNCFPSDNISKVSMQSRARLWAGMGSIYEVRCAPSNKNIMVKYVHPRLPPSGELSVGDQRKLDSYLVEANFYEHFANDLLHYHRVPLPPPLYVERHLEDIRNPKIIICMGELSSRPSKDQADDDDDDDDEVNVHTNVVKWLAKFHAATWNWSPSGKDEQENNDHSKHSVQAIGSYWYLKTRRSEWEDMPRHGWEGRLKKAARAIDARLERDPLQCWVHGDTKDANILYSQNKLAFCDFQYTGRGPPSRDLSYYFCSSHVEDSKEQEALLDIYHQDLTNYLKQQPKTSSTLPLPTRQQLEESMELAFCDFCRFMAGWGYWGYDLSRQVKATLDKLDGGKMLTSEDDYDEAVRRVFG